MNIPRNPHATRWSRAVLLLALVLALLLGVTGSGQPALAQYANGSGTGLYQNQIFWLEWNGFNFSNGQTRTFNLAGGLVITASVSNVIGFPVSVGRPEDYGPAAMNKAYPGTGFTAIKSCNGCLNRFRLTFTATIAGSSVPVDLVVIDAESANTGEYLKVTTDGNSWQMLEQFQASNLRATFSNSDKTLELRGNGAPAIGSALAVSTGISNLDFELKGGGISAAALGVVVPIDYGDAPASYGDAGHFIRQTFVGGSPGATKVYDPVATTFSNFATITSAPQLYVGAVKPDPDPGSQNSGANGATALGDDNDGGDDEEGIATLPVLSALDTSYSLSVKAFNNKGAAATVNTWIDFNRNGSFDASELKSVSVPSSAAAQTLVFTWTGLSNLSAGQSYVRTRISSASGLGPTGSALDGEVEDYALTIAPPASISIVKEATPQDGTDFPFTLTGPSVGTLNFTLDDAVQDDGDGYTWRKVAGSLRGGKYLLTEFVPAGWTLASIRCISDRTGITVVQTPPSVLLTLRESENVICTFVNFKQGSLTVEKIANGGDDTFNFTTTGSGLSNFALTTVGGNAQRTFALLNPGRYSVAESTPPSGWQFVQSSCDNGSSPSAIIIDPGEHVTCTFENRRENTIIVVKRAIGGDATFPFSTSTNLEADGTLDLTTVAGSAIQIYSNLGPGAYSIVESALAGWNPTVADPTCSNGDKAGAITLDAGETIVCVFVNLKSDTIVIEKRTVGGDGVFDFTTNLPLTPTFTLTTTQGSAAQNFADLNPEETYAFTETVPPGWDLTSSCDNGQSPSAVQPPPGASVTCTFTNTLRSKLNIVKRTVGGDGTFAFTSTVPGAANFSIVTTGTVGTQNFANIVPGAYAVAETPQSGWTQGAASCDDGSPVNAIVLDPGEVVTCRFDNVENGELVVIKQALGGDGTFAYTSDIQNFNLTTVSGTAAITLTNVVSGVHSVVETPQVGWDQVVAVCDNGSTPDAVFVAPGQRVTCGFLNFKRGALQLTKLAVGGDGAFPFVVGGLPPAPVASAVGALGSVGATPVNITTVNGFGTELFENLPFLRVYSITETVPAGWTLGFAACTDAVDPRAIIIPPGETVDCVFIDAKLPTINVVKQATGGDGSFNFTSGTLPQTAFALSTVSGKATKQFANLPLGVTYDVTETVAAGWDLTGAACDNGDAPGAIDLLPGDVVTCTFVNRVLPATVTGRVWEEISANGIQDPGEVGIPGVTVSLLDTTAVHAAAVVTDTVTDAAGRYTFTVPAGDYLVAVKIPTGYAVTFKGVGSNPNLDSDIDDTGRTALFSVAAGQTVTRDAGIYVAPTADDDIAEPGSGGRIYLPVVGSR